MMLNEKIYYYRRLAGLSQEAVATQVGVSRQAVSKWELGEATPEVDKLLALARLFGVTTDELLGEQDPQPSGGDAPSGNGGGQTTGLLGRLWRRYGWLVGVYIALSGAWACLVGIVGRRTIPGASDLAYIFGGKSAWPSAEGLVFRAAIPNIIMVVGAVIAVVGVILTVVLWRKGRGK